MKHLTRLALAGAATLALTVTGMAQDNLRMATIAPGSSAYLVMTTMATTVNEKQDKVAISVDATGAATKHVIELAEGKLDLCMSSPTVHQFLKDGTAMYQKLSKAPELAKNVGLVYWFPYGSYHVIAYADSGIEKLEDLRGKKVFLGPPGGGAWATAAQWIKSTTGMEPGKDFENVKASWSAALQGFQDRQFDVYITGGIPPYPQVEQLALTSKLRIIGLTKEEADNASEEALAPTKVMGRALDVIPAGTYGDNVVNKEDIYTVGSYVGVVARMDLSADDVYTVTKTFWDNIDEIRKNSPFMKRVTLDQALVAPNIKLHPGALKYYEEAGLTIPDEMK